MRINAERVKVAPAEALRAAFARIGQLLLAADKMRKRGADPQSPTPGGELAAEGATPAALPGGPAEPASAPEGATESTATPARPPAGSAKRSLDRTGNVRLLTAEDLPEPHSPEPEAAPYEPEPPEITEPPEFTERTADLSEADLPEAAAPDTTLQASAPEATASETTAPDTDLETTAPQPTIPDATIPEAAIPDAAIPEATAPDATAPEVALPDAAIPYATAPDATIPEVTAPGTAAAEVAVSLAEVAEAVAVPAGQGVSASSRGTGEGADDEAARFETGLSEADLPVPSYDSLSVPSLRARLRSLDAAQVGLLAEYERSHAGRADVVAMFERRIAKLAGG